MKTTILVLTLLCAPPAASAAQSRPDWLSGRSPAYPKSAFILGVGRGVSEEKAADRARAEVAKYFGIKLVAKSVAAAREVTDGQASSFSQEVSDDVRTFTSQVLEGVELAQYWKDDAGEVYALAALNREQALRTLTGKLEEIDRESAGLADEMETEEGKFARLKLALDLVRNANSRKSFNKQYRILNPDGKGLKGPSLSKALRIARKAIRAISVQVAAEGENSGAVRTRIIDELGSFGLRAVETGGSRTPDLLIEAYAEAEPLPPENLLWFWSKGAIVIRLSYGATGEVFTKFQESAQEASRDPGSSVDRTLLALATRASRRVYRIITTQELHDD